jgi:hypothetical protein
MMCENNFGHGQLHLTPRPETSNDLAPAQEQFEDINFLA